MCNEVLKDVSIVYFDGRLTEGAIVVAIAARKAGIPILVEAERLRPNLELLMAEADYIVMSANFPRDWTGEECLGDALLATALRLPHVKFLVRVASSASVFKINYKLLLDTSIQKRCL